MTDFYDNGESFSESDALPVPYAVIWLDGLADVLRRTGLRVIEVGGWERRSRRGNTGYTRHPTHIMIHHTASSTTAGNDVNYMVYGSPDRPIANIYIARNGDIHLMAGGPTNTNGSGRDWWGGGVPANDMNAEAIGIEIGNDGTGEPYPEPQLESARRVCVELLKADGRHAGFIRSHWEWCRDTGRKIDPRGPSRYEDPTLGGKWNMDRFRSDVFVAMNPPVTHDIYAGVDTNGTNYNVNDWIVPGGGAGLVRQGDGSLRSCQLRNGVVTLGVQNPMSYNRPMTARTFQPPYELSGQIMLHSRAKPPVMILGENREPTWEWRINIHPCFADEDNNIVTGLGPAANKWSASGQINGAYGIPRKEVFVAQMDHDAQLGSWHTWRINVPRAGLHEVYWDNVLVYRVVEADPPAAWWGRPQHVALRLDFYDYSIRLDEPQPPSAQGADDMIILDLNPGTNFWVAMVLGNTELTHIVNGNHVAVLERGKVPRVKVNESEVGGILSSIKTTNRSPFRVGLPSYNAHLDALWNAASI